MNTEMPVDLDSYSGPLRDAETLAQRREALIAQLAWLASEAKVLKPLLKDLSNSAIDEASIEGGRSVKETVALLAAIDQELTLSWIESVLAGAEEPLATPEELPLDSESDIEVLLDRLRDVRSRVVRRFRELDEGRWAQAVNVDGQATDVYGLALAIVQRDADLLRSVAYHLHGSGLGAPGHSGRSTS